MLCLYLLCLVSIVSGAHRTNKRMVIDEIPKPNDPIFHTCYIHTEAGRWLCWDNSAKTFDTEIEHFLLEWPSHRVECCAVWHAEKCQDAIRQQEPACQANVSRRYFEHIHDKYLANGCEPYASQKHLCSSAFQHHISPMLIFAICVSLLMSSQNCRVFLRMYIN